MDFSERYSNPQSDVPESEEEKLHLIEDQIANCIDELKEIKIKLLDEPRHPIKTKIYNDINILINGYEKIPMYSKYYVIC